MHFWKHKRKGPLHTNHTGIDCARQHWRQIQYSINSALAVEIKAFYNNNNNNNNDNNNNNNNNDFANF